MELKKLYPNCLLEIEITGITTDSRYVEPGYLFIPLAGDNFLGEEFVGDAAQKGAVVAILSKPLFSATIPIIVVNDITNELIRLLQTFYQKPYEDITLIGITGTDGKTSSSLMTSHLLGGFNHAAYIGTNGINYLDQSFDKQFTTPILSENYRLLNTLVKHGLTYSVMEVSSEGIKAGRIKSLWYDYTVFTNLSHEHLNTHHTLRNYFETKKQLFKQMKKTGIALINKDDEMAKFFDDTHHLTFSLFEPSDYQAINIKTGKKYTTFDLQTKETIYKNLKLNRLEIYNIYNALPAIIIALLENVPLPLIYQRLASIPIISGRLERIHVETDFNIYIDFAHTPNALLNVLSDLKGKTKKNLIVICGSAGNKDKSKRPLMGKVACDIADYVIFTSEDPKNEKAIDIINQMASGTNRTNYTKVINRFSAIDLGISIAEAGDTVLVTGKGRECFFEENGVITPYSDYDSIIEVVSGLKKN